MKTDNQKLVEKIREFLSPNAMQVSDIFNLVKTDRKEQREKLLKHLPDAIELGDMLTENTDDDHNHTSLDGVSRTLKDFVEGILDNINYDAEHKRR